MPEQDPGSTGKKLSKSGWGESALFERNRSYGKVLDAQINWIRARNENQPNSDELLERWQKKSEWHEKTFGW